LTAAMRINKGVGKPGGPRERRLIRRVCGLTALIFPARPLAADEKDCQGEDKGKNDGRW
jgi:hypothetical protein